MLRLQIVMGNGGAMYVNLLQSIDNKIFLVRRFEARAGILCRKMDSNKGEVCFHYPIWGVHYWHCSL